MSVRFPSLEFFRALSQALSDHPESVASLDPSEAYCGLAVDDSLFVLEFDGRECAGVAPGGNLLDLDFVLAAPAGTWQELLRGGESLAALVERGAIEIRSENDDGPELARESLPFLQGFLGQAGQLDVEYA